MQSSDSEDEIFFGPVVSCKERKKIEQLKGRKTEVLDPSVLAAVLAGRDAPTFQPEDDNTENKQVSMAQKILDLGEEDAQNCSNGPPKIPSSETREHSHHDTLESKENLVEEQALEYLSSRSSQENFDLQSCQNDFEVQSLQTKNQSSELPFSIENFSPCEKGIQNVCEDSQTEIEVSNVPLEDLPQLDDDLMCSSMAEGLSIDLRSEEGHGLSPLKLSLPCLGTAAFRPQNVVAIDYGSHQAEQSFIDDAVEASAATLETDSGAVVVGYSECPLSLSEAGTHVNEAETSIGNDEINVPDIEIEVQDAETNVAKDETDIADAKTNVGDAGTVVADNETNVAFADEVVAEAETNNTTDFDREDGIEILTNADGISSEPEIVDFNEARSSNVEINVSDAVADCSPPALSEKSVYFSVNQESLAANQESRSVIQNSFSKIKESLSTETMEYFSAQCTMEPSKLIADTQFDNEVSLVDPSALPDSSNTKDAKAGFCSTQGSCDYNYLSDKFSIISIDEKDNLDVSSSAVHGCEDAPSRVEVEFNGSVLSDSPLGEEKSSSTQDTHRQTCDTLEASPRPRNDASGTFANTVIEDTLKTSPSSEREIKRVDSLGPNSNIMESELKDPFLSVLQNNNSPCAVTPPPRVGFERLFPSVTSTLTAAEMVTPPPPQITSKTHVSSVMCDTAPHGGSPLNTEGSFATEDALVDSSPCQLAEVSAKNDRFCELKPLSPNETHADVYLDSTSLSLLANVAIADERNSSIAEDAVENVPYELHTLTRPADHCKTPQGSNSRATFMQSLLTPTHIKNSCHDAKVLVGNASLTVTPGENFRRDNSIAFPENNATPSEINGGHSSGNDVPFSPAREKFLAFAKELKEGKISDTSPFKALVSVPGRSAIRNINKELGLLDESRPEESERDPKGLTTPQFSVPSSCSTEIIDQGVKAVQNTGDLQPANDDNAKEVTLAAAELEEEAERVVRSIEERSIRPRESFFTALEVIDVHKPDIYGTFITDTEQENGSQLNDGSSLEKSNVEASIVSPYAIYDKSGHFNPECSYNSETNTDYGNDCHMMQFNDTLERMDYLLKASQEYNQKLREQQLQIDVSHSRPDSAKVENHQATVSKECARNNMEHALISTDNDALNLKCNQASRSSDTSSVEQCPNLISKNTANNEQHYASNPMNTSSMTQHHASSSKNSGTPNTEEQLLEDSLVARSMDDSGNQTVSEVGTHSSSSSEVAPANIAMHELTSSSVQSDDREEKHEGSDHGDVGSLTSELSVLSFKKHSLNSQVSNSSFTPMLDSTHTSCVPKGIEPCKTASKDENSVILLSSNEDLKHAGKCSASSTLDHRQGSESLSVHRTNSGKTPAKPPRLGRNLKPVAVVSPNLSESPNNAQRSTNKGQLRLPADAKTPCNRNTFAPKTTPASRAYSAVPKVVTSLSTRTPGGTSVSTRTPATSLSSRTPATSSLSSRTPATTSLSSRTPATTSQSKRTPTSLLTKTPVTTSSSRLPASQMSGPSQTKCTSRGVNSALRNSNPRAPGSSQAQSAKKLCDPQLPPTTSARNIRHGACISSTPSRHVKPASTQDATPQGPVARELLKNPPPSLYTNVKPKYSIGPRLEREMKRCADPLEPADLNESMKQRQRALDRIQSKLDQLTAKSPGTCKKSPASGSGAGPRSSPSVLRHKALLPQVDYKHATPLLLGNKENVSPRRPCCKNKTEANATPLQVIKHSGRVLMPKAGSEGESLMEVSVLERRSILHTNTLAAKK